MKLTFRPTTWLSLARLNLLGIALLATLVLADGCLLAAELRKIDNGEITVGLKLDSGGAIAWISAGKSQRNLVNAFDRGRLIQQSYYGDEDGSLWNDKPWRWNPVQGGDWRGAPARLLAVQNTATTANVKSFPKHWASGQEISTATMEQSIELVGPVARIRYRFEQKGGRDHSEQDQELPAVFLQPDLSKLVVYSGDKPWTGDALEDRSPGWPNEYGKMTEHWAAYVDDQSTGLGVFVPVADRLTCYRYPGDAKSVGACSYFAPIRRMAIKADFKWEYEVFITTGSIEEIRSRFSRLAAVIKSESDSAQSKDGGGTERKP